MLPESEGCAKGPHLRALPSPTLRLRLEPIRVGYPVSLPQSASLSLMIHGIAVSVSCRFRGIREEERP